jgi:hypothetical protein
VFVPAEPPMGPRCRCGCPYLRGLVLLDLVLTASPGRGIRLVGRAVRDVAVESLTCEACARETLTSDLPPIGVDVAAVLEQLADAEYAVRPLIGRRSVAPACLCGAQALTWSSIVAITVHAAGASMLGEVSSSRPVGARTGTLSCGACCRSWDVELPDLPAQVSEAIGAFSSALSCGEVGLDE